jgi:hypothetical protein
MDAIAKGAGLSVKASLVPGEAVIERRPSIGMVVLYFSSASEDLPGGHRPHPAIVTDVNSGAPDFLLSLAVVDLSAHMVARTRVMHRAACELYGADPAVAHWEYIADAG